MKPRIPLAILAAVVLVATPLVGVLTAHAQSPAKRYVCPPCNLDCDHLAFDHPGACPKCGMALVDAASLPPPRTQPKVAILIFDGVQVIDFTGPFEIFQAAGYDVYTVAATKDPLHTVAGMTVVPKFSFADAPLPDVLVVPGGGVKAASDDAATLGWVKGATARAQHTMSVCNGAFILAHAGLLDGLQATTTAHNLERLRTQFPKVRVVDDRRWVDNGKVITTGGLTAGIDGALHVIAVMHGEGAAQQVALAEEHPWNPAGGYSRAALADMEIPDVDMSGYGDWDVVSTRGDQNRWDMVLSGRSKRSLAEIMDHTARTFETQGKWTRAGAASSTSATSRTERWTFTGRGGKPWKATLRLESVAGDSGRYTATLAVARNG
jgi:putative intracellular protease/amidase